MKNSDVFQVADSLVCQEKSHEAALVMQNVLSLKNSVLLAAAAALSVNCIGPEFSADSGEGGAGMSDIEGNTGGRFGGGGTGGREMPVASGGSRAEGGGGSVENNGGVANVENTGGTESGGTGGGGMPIDCQNVNLKITPGANSYDFARSIDDGQEGLDSTLFTRMPDTGDNQVFTTSQPVQRMQLSKNVLLTHTYDSDGSDNTITIEVNGSCIPYVQLVTDCIQSDNYTPMVLEEMQPVLQTWIDNPEAFVADMAIDLDPRPYIFRGQMYGVPAMICVTYVEEM